MASRATVSRAVVPARERRTPSRHRHTTPGSVNHRIAMFVRDAVEASGHPMTLGAHRDAYVARYGPMPAAWNARFYQLVRFGILIGVDGRTSKTRYAHRDQAAGVSGTRDQHAGHDRYRTDATTHGNDAAQHDDDDDDVDEEHRDEDQHVHDHREDRDGIRDAQHVDHADPEADRAQERHVSLPEGDDARVVLDALHRLCRAHGRPVSTREVADSVRARGAVIGDGHPNAVRQRLGTLSTPRVRGHAAWHAPRVRRDTLITASGRPSARWWACDLTPTETHATPASQTEALRTVVHATCAALGRPADVRELRLWMRVHHTHPACDILTDVQIGDLLPRIVRSDTTRVANGRIVSVHGDRETGGRAPTRYIIREQRRARGADTTVCRLLDLIATLEVADEIREIATLEHRARRLSAPSVARLAQLRRDALWDAFAPILTSSTDRAAPTHDERLATSMAVVTRSMHQVVTWITAVQATSRDGAKAMATAMRRAQAIRRHGDAVACTLRDATRRNVALVSAERQESLAAVQCVSSATAVELREIAPFLTSAAREWERPDTFATHRALIGDARVFAAAAPVRITAAREGSFVPRIRVDRVDALAALYLGLPAVRAGALIASAMELMGRVVRDASVIAAIRDAGRPTAGDRRGGRTPPTGSDHPSVWRAAVVGLGLLGVEPAPADWEAGAGTPDHAALCLATVLADPSAAVSPISDFVTLRSQIASVAARRVALGRLMTVTG